MSSQPPPTVIIFNGIAYNDAFFTTNTGTLTYQVAVGDFITFPTSQNAPITFLNDINIEGNLLQTSGTGHAIIGSSQSIPSGTSTIQGTGFYWNQPNGSGYSYLLNYGQGTTTGGFSFNAISATQTPYNLAILNSSSLILPTQSIQIVQGAGNGKVLTSDGSGN